MKPACWEACFLYPCPTVEHSNNCLLLLCVLFLKPSGHYTKITTTGYIELSLPSWNTSTGMNHMLMNPLTKVKTLKLRFKVNTDIPKGTKDYIICAIPSGYEPKYYVENVSVTMMGVPYLLHVPQGGKSLYFSYNQSVILHDDEFFITLTFV